MSMKRYLALLFCLISLSAFSNAQNAFSEKDLSESGQKAFKTLLGAERFENVAIGPAGELSKYVEAYRVLLKEQLRANAFKELLQKATMAGQLYALAGLYDADNAYFQSVVAKYKDSKEKVQSMDGCLFGISTVGLIVFLDKPNTVRLSSPSQPFSEWKQKANISKDQGFMIDISGGGYSLFFRGYDL
jgi:hypothetical protein